MVSICGGEPMIYPGIGELVAKILERKKVVYLCTNGMFIRKKVGEFKPHRRFFFNVHLDGMRQNHDIAVEREGVFDAAIDGIKAAKEAGFLVCTNTTVFKETDMRELDELFGFLTGLDVNGFLISARLKETRLGKIKWQVKINFLSAPASYSPNQENPLSSRLVRSNLSKCGGLPLCLVFLDYQVDRKAPVLLGANREESFRRPTTSPVCCRSGAFRCLLAGADHGPDGTFPEMGTWLGVNETGLVVAVTNRNDGELRWEDQIRVARAAGRGPAGFR